MTAVYAIYETDEEVYGTDIPQIHEEHIYAQKAHAQKALQALAKLAAEAYDTPCCEDVGDHWSHGTTHLNIVKLEVKW